MFTRTGRFRRRRRLNVAADPMPANITIAMPKLCQITVPGLEVRADWRLVHDRLLDEFPEVADVLATTIPATVLIASSGPPDPARWLDLISETVKTSRRTVCVNARGIPRRALP
jgi:hypothetical protein